MFSYCYRSRYGDQSFQAKYLVLKWYEVGVQSLFGGFSYILQQIEINQIQAQYLKIIDFLVRLVHFQIFDLNFQLLELLKCLLNAEFYISDSTNYIVVKTMQKALSGRRKTITHIQTQCSQTLPFSQRFKGKINQISKEGPNDILLRMTEKDSQMSSIEVFKSKIQDIIKSGIRTVTLKRSLVRKSSCQNKQNMNIQRNRSKSPLQEQKTKKSSLPELKKSFCLQDIKSAKKCMLIFLNQ